MSYGIKADVTSLDDDLKLLRSSKFSKEAVDEIQDWIFKSVLKDSGYVEENPGLGLLRLLKDGTVLSKLANEIYKADNPNVELIKYKKSKMPFVQMEQISQFLQFAREYGVPEDELFQTIDLFEEKDSAIVYQTLKSLSRYANKKHPEVFPVIGPQLATKRERPPIKQKPAHLQEKYGWSTQEYGYMKGASQATEGVVFGQRRDVA